MEWVVKKETKDLAKEIGIYPMRPFICLAKWCLIQMGICS